MDQNIKSTWNKLKIIPFKDRACSNCEMLLTLTDDYIIICNQCKDNWSKNKFYGCIAQAPGSKWKWIDEIS